MDKEKTSKRKKDVLILEISDLKVKNEKLQKDIVLNNRPFMNHVKEDAIRLNEQIILCIEEVLEGKLSLSEQVSKIKEESVDLFRSEQTKMNKEERIALHKKIGEKRVLSSMVELIKTKVEKQK